RDVLDEGEGPVGQVLPGRHAAGERLAPRADAGAQDHVADVGLDEPGQQRGEAAVVLVVRVDHHDDVGLPPPRLVVAGLLVGAVAAVLGVHDDREAEAPRDVDRPVAAGVVHDQDLVDAAGGDVAVSLLEGGSGVVRRHHGHDLVVTHEESTPPASYPRAADGAKRAPPNPPAGGEPTGIKPGGI